MNLIAGMEDGDSRWLKGAYWVEQFFEQYKCEDERATSGGETLLGL